MQATPTATRDLTAGEHAECRFRGEMQKLVEHQASSGKSIVLSTEKFTAIVDVLKHPEDSARKYSSQFRSWVRYRGFKLLDFPELGQREVLVRPACLDSKLIKGDGPEHLTVLQAPDLYEAVKHVHTQVFHHGGYKRVLDYGNSSYGRSLMRKERHQDVKVMDADDAQKAMHDPFFNHLNQISKTHYEMQRHYYGVTRGFVQQFVGACPVCRTLRPNSATNFRPGPKPAQQGGAPAPDPDPDTKPLDLELDVAAPQEIDLAGPLRVADTAAEPAIETDRQESDSAHHHHHRGDDGSPPGHDDDSWEAVYAGDVAAASNGDTTRRQAAGREEDVTPASDPDSDPDPTSRGSWGSRHDAGRVVSSDGGGGGGGSQARQSDRPKPSSSTSEPGLVGRPDKRTSRTVVDGDRVYVVTLNEDREEEEDEDADADASAIPPDHAPTSSPDESAPGGVGTRLSRDTPATVIKQEPADDDAHFCFPARWMTSPAVSVKRPDPGGGVSGSPRRHPPRPGQHDVISGGSRERGGGGGDGDAGRTLARKRPAVQSSFHGAFRPAKSSVVVPEDERGFAQRDWLWRSSSVASPSVGRPFPPSTPRVFISVGAATLSSKKPLCITTTTTTTTTTTSAASVAVEPFRCDVTPRSSSRDNDDVNTTPTPTPDPINNANSGPPFFDVLHLDIIDMRHAPDGGHRFIAHATDPSRKLHVLFPLPESSASAVAAALDLRVLALYGMPGTLCSNRGHRFVEEVLAALAGLVEGGVTCVNGEAPPGGAGGSGRKAASRARRTNVVEELINLLRVERGSDPRTGGVPWLSWLPRIMRSLNRDWHADLRANSAPLTS